MFASFLIFSAVVIALLWFLEVVFLGDIYRMTKIQAVRSAATEMVGMTDEKMNAFVEKVANENGVCTGVYDSNMDLLAGQHAGGQCVVHNINKRTAALFYDATKNCDGMRFESHLPAEEIAEVLKKSEMSKNFFQGFMGFGREEQSYLTRTEDTHDCVLYCQVISNDEGEERFALLSAVIVPIASTKLAIRFELALVSICLLIISVAVAYFLSRSISSPLVKLNFASKSLPEGRFDNNGISGYREVEELSQTLSRSADEISKVDQLRRELIANVSHDLRTPLTLISGYSEAMRDIPGENTPENLQIVIDETRRLTKLVSDLLDLSKMEAGMDTLKSERLELVSFVSEICQRYHKMTGLQGIDLRLESFVDSAYVSADPVKLNQVIYNLINNAIHYCGEDRFVGVRVSKNQSEAIIEVIDHGEGIPKEKLSQIWDRYYRIDKNHRAASIGSGLGLSIVKKILTLHAARFGVESGEGKGSRFWFALPLDYDDPAF